MIWVRPKRSSQYNSEENGSSDEMIAFSLWIIV